MLWICSRYHYSTVESRKHDKIKNMGLCSESYILSFRMKWGKIFDKLPGIKNTVQMPPMGIISPLFSS